MLNVRRYSTVPKGRAFNQRQVQRPGRDRPASTPLAPPEPIQAPAADKTVEVTFVISPQDDGMRLDRWVRSKFPGTPQSMIERMLRKRQILIAERSPRTKATSSVVSQFVKAQSNSRVVTGMKVRFPSSLTQVINETPKQPPMELTEAKKKEMRRWIVHQDPHVLVINKPPDLAVQGGTGIKESIDAMLPGFKDSDDAETPVLVHRLDQSTSGLLVLAKTKQAARALSEAWASHQVRKLYWAITIGEPTRLAGTIKVPLLKVAGNERGDGAEKIIPILEERKELPPEAKMSITQYRTVYHASDLISFLALRPRTGRTHQLRVHCANVLNVPIIGDYKYGPGIAPQFKTILPEGKPRLHLHAREIAFRHPMTKEVLHIRAPPPEHMLNTMRLFGLETHMKDPYAGLDATDLKLQAKAVRQTTLTERSPSIRIPRPRDPSAQVARATRGRSQPTQEERSSIRGRRRADQERSPQRGRRQADEDRKPPRAFNGKGFDQRSRVRVRTFGAKSASSNKRGRTARKR